MKHPSLLLVAAVCTVLLAGCGKHMVAVDSGTYEGTVSEVNAEEEEIYVDIGDGRTLELYFTEETELTRDGETAVFGALDVGQRVSVTVNRVGNRLDPVTVEILQ